jgi:AcrR family transcriptional regulator
MGRALAVPARTRRTRLRPEARREQLLDAAGALLLASGFDALTMEGVAQRAGVSKGLGYAYFENAEDVALALHQREVEAVYRRVEAAMRAPGSFDRRCRSALVAYFELVQERGALFALLETRLSSRLREGSAQQQLGGFLSFWTTQLRDELGLAPAAATALAGVLLTVADRFARSWLGGRLSRAEAERLCADFVGAGLRAAVAGSRA